MTSTVGPVVGPLGAATSGAAASLPDVGEGYDFAIGGLGFHLAISDERKYERATAQFRKEQYDTSDNPGDQSLVGFWTRGQLSFHDGAGQRYADVSQSSLSDNRFWTSSGVNPFVKGEASLYPAWDAATPDSHTGIIDCQPVGTDSLAVLAGGRVTYGAIGAAGTVYPDATSSTSVIAMASGGGNIYCAMSDNTIHRVGLSLAYPVVYSTSFESGLDGWASSDVFATAEVATVALSGGTVDDGAQSMEITWPASSTTDISYVFRTFSGLVTGRAYTLVTRVWTAVGTGANVRPSAIWTKDGDAVTTEGAWVTSSLTFVAPATAFAIGIKNSNLGAGGEKTYVDKVVLYEGSRVGYDDGTVPTEAIYSHTSTIVEIHYAKDRLFIMDETGTWYQLAPNPSAALPVAVAAGDMMFRANTEGGWTVSDTPGPVLLANGSRVFAVTQDAAGLYPTLTAPIQVADLPVGESVIGMAHYLGFVVLVTTRGVRVAILGDSGITYGPRLTDWEVEAFQTGVARDGESVYVTGDHRIVEINLASQIGDGLEFGWADLPTPFTSETNYGVTQFDGKVVAWGGAVLDIQQDTPHPSGTLETSYHRFGTLEPKRFHTVKVRMTGGGTVSIAKVDRNGAATSLYTAAASEGEVEVTLREVGTTDRLALRFTLTAEAGVSPELLSYQLRALPAPERQRMIRVPLMLQDVERRGSAPAKGYTGSAWERLKALEELEETGGTVVFQDFRTGESGLCFIEQVAHEGDTPPGRQSDGFGGPVFVTLRKL